jgi:O-antigen/teichoic acid export membrane protein
VDLRTRTVKGVTWTIASQFVRLLITLVVTAILARLLSPKDFGLIAMVAVFSNFFAMLNEMGLGSAIIQKPQVTEEELSSAFWVNLIEGVVVTLAFLALAPVIAGFYSQSILKPIVMVMSIMFTISSVGMIQLALFSKRMDFRTLAMVEVAAAVAGGVVAVAMAATGFGVWSIVALSLVQCLVLAVVLFIVSSWKPRLLVKWQPIKGLLKYGLPLMGFSFVNYFNRNLDNLLIGKYLGTRQLGYYDVAYRSILFPLGNVSSVIGRVMFPALSHMEENKTRVRAAYVRANRYIAVITFPLMAGLAVLAPQLVRVALGPKWARAIFLIQVLAMVSTLQSLSTTTGWIYLSQARTGIMLVWGVISVFICAGALAIGLHWNVEGVAVAYAIVTVLLTYPCFAIPFRFIDMKFWYFVKQFKTIALATLGMAAVMVGLRFLFERVVKLGDIPTLVVLILVGATCYFLLLWLVDKSLLSGLLEVLHDIRSRAPSSEEET